MTRILITGGTGFIGRHLVPLLVARGDTAVSLLVRESYSHTDLQTLPTPLQAIRTQLQLVYADLRNFKLTSRAIAEAAPDAVIHLAAVGATNPFLPVATALRHNLDGTLNLLRACFESRGGVQQVVVARTPGELTSMNVYAASKAAAWGFCEMYGRTQQWPIHGAMVYQAYGPGQPDHTLIPAAAAAAQAGHDFPMTSGTQVRDWIAVGDVAAGLAAMVGQPLPPGETAELGTGVATSVADVVGLIYELAGNGGRPLPGALPGRPGETPQPIADAARTAQLIGWRAATPLRDGLRMMLGA